MQPTLLPNKNIDIKSPIFKPEPGWGGQIKKWLKNNFSRYIFPIISILVLLFGLYRIIK